MLRLSEFMGKPLNEALNDFDMKDIQVCTDNGGNVRSITLEYISKEDKPPVPVSPQRKIF